MNQLIFFYKDINKYINDNIDTYFTENNVQKFTILLNTLLTKIYNQNFPNYTYILVYTVDANKNVYISITCQENLTKQSRIHKCHLTIHSINPLFQHTVPEAIHI